MNLCLLLNLCLCVCKGLCFRFLGAWWRWAIVSSTISVTCNCAFPFCTFCVCFPVFVCLFVFVFTLYLIECCAECCATSAGIIPVPATCFSKCLFSHSLFRTNQQIQICSFQIHSPLINTNTNAFYAYFSNCLHPT